MFPGDRITELREEKGISKAQFAADIHVSRPSVSDYENGKQQPSMSVLLQIAEYFEVSLDFLMGRTNIKSTYSKIEQKLSTRSGMVPIDTIFKLDKEEKEVIGLMLNVLVNKQNK